MSGAHIAIGVKSSRPLRVLHVPARGPQHVPITHGISLNPRCHRWRKGPSTAKHSQRTTSPPALASAGNPSRVGPAGRLVKAASAGLWGARKIPPRLSQRAAGRSDFACRPPTTPRGNRALPRIYSATLHGPESPPRRSHVPGAHWGAREKIPRALTDAPWRAAFTPAALTPHTRPRRPYRPLTSIRRSSGFTLAGRQPPQARGAASGGVGVPPRAPRSVLSRHLPPTHLFPAPPSPRARLHTHTASGSVRS